MNTTYDPNKEANNQQKYGVNFAKAQTALLDEYGLVQEDGETEQRFVLLGRSAKERLLVVVYAVWDEEANLIRLISAHLATNRERDSYESGICDFSNAKRASDVPRLNRLRTAQSKKPRITIMLDNDVIEGFKARASEHGTGYQTEINSVLREVLQQGTLEEVMRRVIRDELKLA